MEIFGLFGIASNQILYTLHKHQILHKNIEFNINIEFKCRNSKM